MNLSKLHIGLRVKDYPTMCELLDEPEKNGGSSKPAQLKRWRQHFSWREEGRAFIITEIYERPLPKPFKADDMYTEDILIILHDYFKGSGSRTFFSGELLDLLGFTNGRKAIENRTNEKTAEPERFDLSDYDYLIIRQNFEYHITYFKSIMTTSFERLEQRNYLNWERTVKIKRLNGSWELASPEEHGIYKDIDRQAKSELGIKTISLWNREKYNGLMHDKLLKQKWLDAKPSITINYQPQFDIDWINFNAKEARKRINDKVVSKMISFIDSDIQKDIQYKMKYFDNDPEEDNDNAWLINYFYPTPEDKYIAINSGTMDDLRNARKELIKLYISLDGAVEVKSQS